MQNHEISSRKNVNRNNLSEINVEFCKKKREEAAIMEQIFTMEQDQKNESLVSKKIQLEKISKQVASLDNHIIIKKAQVDAVAHELDSRNEHDAQNLKHLLKKAALIKFEV